MNVKKAVLSLAVSAALVVTALPAHGHAAEGDAPTVINGGILQNNRTLIPLRLVAEHLGASVDWNSQTKTVTIAQDGLSIKLTVNSDRIVVNDTELVIDVPVTQQYGSTYVPLRFVSQALGADVEWSQSAKQATVLYKGNRIVIIPEKPRVQLPSSQRATMQWQQKLIDKLNEATDVSSIKQIRAYFKPFFTDRFINTIVQNKGLEFGDKFTTLHLSSILYIDTTHASLNQANYKDSSEYGFQDVDRRKISLVYTNGVWKVDQVAFDHSQFPLYP